ncbi:hypothetical protein [Roseisolibacter agri]|uniref:Uncharacterized protein n=1 Tax=Roseisolibacter agri TaxID=2014610 RepID=A0AA37VG27_9BACT|nr:hypothetical protein [Roseisolibacter agri]GLC27809.1 hypothetical protein rosag_43220 [Roseisolibacter agri]
MTINVVFRGPCLFVKGQENGKETLDYVLLPDGTRVRPHGSSKDGEHPDHTRAKKHHAGLIVRNADGTTEKPIPLQNKRVTVREKGAGGRCALDPSFSPQRVVPLSQLTNGPDASHHLSLIDEAGSDFWDRVTTKVTFDGGEMGVHKNSRLVFDFPPDHNPNAPGSRRIPLLAIWSPKASHDAEIVIGPGKGPGVSRVIPLGDGQRAWIYNYDHPEPDPERMECEEDACAKHPNGARLEDYDFKWLFQVLEPPKGDWPEWLKKGPLPAPRSSCPGLKPQDEPHILSPDVASCFFGSWP